MDEIQKAHWFALVEDRTVAVLAEVENGTVVVCRFDEFWPTEFALMLARQVVFEHEKLRGIDPVALHVASIGGGR